MGGLARRASAIDALRQPDDGLILVDIGDSLGTQAWAQSDNPTLQRPAAETQLQALGVMGLDALVPGEVELVLGLDFLVEQAARAGFSLVCANLKSARGSPPKGLVPRLLLDRGGLKVGLVGLLDLTGEPDELRQLVRKAGFSTEDPMAAGRAQVKALQGEGAEVIVVLAHMPLQRSQELARTVPGIHLMLLGHSGMRTGDPLREGGTFLVEAGRRGRELGHVRLEVGPGWKAEARLEDDTQRFALYERAATERQRLEQALKAGSTGPELLREQRNRLEALIKEYEAVRRTERLPATLAALLVPLLDEVPDHPAVRALLQGKQAQNEQPRPVQPMVATPAPPPPAGAIGISVRGEILRNEERLGRPLTPDEKKEILEKTVNSGLQASGASAASTAAPASEPRRP